jgi:hypothetical protein
VGDPVVVTAQYTSVRVAHTEQCGHGPQATRADSLLTYRLPGFSKSSNDVVVFRARRGTPTCASQTLLAAGDTSIRGGQVAHLA